MPFNLSHVLTEENLITEFICAVCQQLVRPPPTDRRDRDRQQMRLGNDEAFPLYPFLARFFDLRSA